MQQAHRRTTLNEPLSGLVTKAISGFFTVATEQGDIIAQIPGRLKQERRTTDIVAVGDRVTVLVNDDGSGTIDSVAERKSVLSRARPAASFRQLQSDLEQVWVANPDQVLFVFAIARPSPSLRKLDRFLVVAELNDLPALIVVNKVDLVKPGEPEAMFGLYETIGYRVIYTSAKTGAGVAELRDVLAGKLSVLTGSSGVGKTSLLNAVQPELGGRVRSVSEATEKGMHTTRHVELVPLGDGGYVADTPGIRGLAVYDIEADELDGYFREIAPLVAGCRFSDCTHKHEKDCAVRAAVADGRLSPHRYDSYLRLREEHEALDRSAY